MKPRKISFRYFIPNPDSIKKHNFIANQIKKELEIRLAHRVINLSEFPSYLKEYKEIVDVKHLYVNSFVKISDFSNIKNEYERQKFGNLLKDIKDNHAYVPITMSRAVQEYKKISNEDPKILNDVLDGFYSSRVGIRTLIDYYNYLFLENNDKHYLHCDIKDVIEKAAIDAVDASIMYYRDTAIIPKIRVNIGEGSIIKYRSSNLYFISFEILKNGIRAMVDGNRNGNIEVDILDASEYNIIIFRDFGPSVKHTYVDNLFDYSFTTVGDDDIHKKELLAGFGHGLPLSRLYARYFGGELLFIPYMNIKTEVVLYINKTPPRYT